MTGDATGIAGPVLTLYGRVYCHLCHDMEQALRDLQAELADGYPFRLECVDVDTDPALEQRWGEWVPALVAGAQELCHYHLDAEAVRAYLRQIR